MNNQPPQISGDQIAHLPVGLRYQVMGMAGRAVHDAGIELSPDDTALDVICRDDYIETAQIQHVREEISSILDHMGASEL